MEPNAIGHFFFNCNVHGGSLKTKQNKTKTKKKSRSEATGKYIHELRMHQY